MRLRRKRAIYGHIYLFCFHNQQNKKDRYGHAGHYLGWAYDLEKRVEQHRSGNGGPLTVAAVEAGLVLVLARTWTHATRDDERRLKRRGGAARICPLCRGSVALNCASDIAKPGVFTRGTELLFSLV